MSKSPEHAAAASEDDYVMVSPAHSTGEAASHESASEPGAACVALEACASAYGSAASASASESDDDTDFWYTYSDTGSDVSSDTGSNVAVEAGGAAAHESGVGDTEASAAHLVHVNLVVRHCGGHGTEGPAPAPVWLHLSHCPPASIHVAPAAARAAVCTIPCNGRSVAAATLGTLPVVPVPLGCGESGQEAAERAAPLATADGSVAVWLLAAREPRERAVSAPEAVRIPEGSVLVLGDARRCGGELGFEDVHFTGGIVAVLGCKAIFQRCTFTGCSAVVTAAGRAKFAGCEFVDAAAPAVVAFGPSATVRLCRGPRGKRTHFRGCAQPLLVAAGGEGDVTHCDFSQGPSSGDCIAATGKATRIHVEDSSFHIMETAARRAACATAVRVTPAWGVRVSEGARAIVRSCRFAGLAGGGVKAEDAADAIVSGCETFRSRRAGFLAAAGAQMHLNSCGSTRDSHAAVHASGADTQLHATNLAVKAATVDGVVVQSGAHAWLQDCTVTEAVDTGVQVAGKAARLWLEGCTISGSGRDGVFAAQGATVHARASCVDLAAKCGVCVDGETSHCTAADCTIRGNRMAGMHAIQGGSVTMRDCKSELNGVALLVRDGGDLTAHACESLNEVGGWLSVSGERSTAYGRDCMARRAESSAVLVADGASVQLHACSLTQAVSHAVTVRDPASAIDMSHCTIGESGGTGVLVARGGTAVMQETTLASSGGNGVEAIDEGAVGMYQCVLQGCADAALRVDRRGVAIAQETVFANATAYGLYAGTAALAVLLGCTLDDTGAAAVFANDGALVATVSCKASGSAVDFYLKGVPAAADGGTTEVGQGVFASGGPGPWMHDGDEAALPVRPGGMATLLMSDFEHLPRAGQFAESWAGQMETHALFVRSPSVRGCSLAVGMPLIALLYEQAAALLERFQARFQQQREARGRFGEVVVMAAVVLTDKAAPP